MCFWTLLVKSVLFTTQRGSVGELRSKQREIRHSSQLLSFEASVQKQSPTTFIFIFAVPPLQALQSCRRMLQRCFAVTLQKCFVDYKTFPMNKYSLIIFSPPCRLTFRWTIPFSSKSSLNQSQLSAQNMSTFADKRLVLKSVTPATFHPVLSGVPGMFCSAVRRLSALLNLPCVCDGWKSSAPTRTAAHRTSLPACSCQKCCKINKRCKYNTTLAPDTRGTFISDCIT